MDTHTCEKCGKDFVWLMCFECAEGELERTGEYGFTTKGSYCLIQESTTEEEDTDGEPVRDVPCYQYDVYATEEEAEEGESSISGGCCTGNLNDCVGMLQEAIGEAELSTDAVEL